ncbi:MAG: polysulfide reductase NrfD [Dehalococcoidales bacterium]|nr:polysulfide reductase NrfD [Dehalococcoidales bacterium]
MQTRQWMTTHEWMVKPMQQREWIERKGLLVGIAETFTSLGSGLFLVSLFMSNWWGMVVGWVIIMFFKLPMHIIYLGKPERIFRIMPPFSNAWKTSWFARGIIFTILFSSFAFVQLVVGHPYIADLIGPAAAPVYSVFAVLAAIFAVGTGIYGGFMMNYCKSVPFWNTGILPVVFVLAGVADGFGLIIAISLAGGGGDIAAAEMWSRITIGINAVIIVVYLISANYTSTIASLSVRQLLVGKAAVAFWLGLVVLGLVVPLAISVSSVFTETGVSSVLLITAVVCHSLGAYALKYCLLKVGIHRPILPRVGAY